MIKVKILFDQIMVTPAPLLHIEPFKPPPLCKPLHLYPTQKAIPLFIKHMQSLSYNTPCPCPTPATWGPCQTDPLPIPPPSTPAFSSRRLTPFPVLLSRAPIKLSLRNLARVSCACLRMRDANPVEALCQNRFPWWDEDHSVLDKLMNMAGEIVWQTSGYALPCLTMADRGQTTDTVSMVARRGLSISSCLPPVRYADQ